MLVVGKEVVKMEGLEVKVEKIYRLDTDGELKGFADISIGDSFVIKGLRIVENRQGLYVSMPKELGKDGKWYSRVSVINNDIKSKLTDMILSAFKEE